MAILIQYYKWLFTDLADPRVKDWALMSSPLVPLFIIVFYLHMIKNILPVWMQYKDPYDLKTVIKCYNIFQIIANSYVFFKVLTSGWLTHLHMGCILPDYSNDPEAVRLAEAMHFFVLLKVVELIETAFFILRKKNNQASFLHIYHHVVTLIMMWIAVKYVAGGMASFPVLMNAFIHVVMYTYYYISSVASPETRKKINKYKPWLTIMQMVQFSVAIVHGLQALLPSCGAPKFMVYCYIPNVVIVYYLFLDFFKNSYNKKKKA